MRASVYPILCCCTNYNSITCQLQLRAFPIFNIYKFLLCFFSDFEHFCTMHNKKIVSIKYSSNLKTYFRSWCWSHCKDFHLIPADVARCTRDKWLETESHQHSKLRCHCCCKPELFPHEKHLSKIRRNKINKSFKLQL